MNSKIEEICGALLICVFMVCSAMDCTAAKDARSRVRAACIAHHAPAACSRFEP